MSSSFGNDDGQFQGPWDVEFDNKGNVYVADFLTDTIVMLCIAFTA